jgi:hypothetical protein
MLLEVIEGSIGVDKHTVPPSCINNKLEAERKFTSDQEGVRIGASLAPLFLPFEGEFWSDLPTSSFFS